MIRTQIDLFIKLTKFSQCRTRMFSFKLSIISESLRFYGADIRAFPSRNFCFINCTILMLRRADFETCVLFIKCWKILLNTRIFINCRSWTILNVLIWNVNLRVHNTSRSFNASSFFIHSLF